jgi:hypothetical protein
MMMIVMMTIIIIMIMMTNDESQSPTADLVEIVINNFRQIHNPSYKYPREDREEDNEY